MGEIKYDSGFSVLDGSDSVGGDRMDVACFFYVFPFLLLMAGKVLILSTSYEARM